MLFSSHLQIWEPPAVESAQAAGKYFEINKKLEIKNRKTTKIDFF